MKKKILALGLVALCCASMLAFTSCKKSSGKEDEGNESSVQSIEGTTGIEYTLSDNGEYYVISGFNGTAKKVVCGDTYKDLPVKEIGNYAFFNTNIETLTIADSIEKIGEYAFFNCDYLYDVDFGTGLKVIDDYAFSACRSFVNVNLPEGVTHINACAFFSSGVINVNIPDSIEFIGLDAFDLCESLRVNRFDTALYLGNPNNKFAALIIIDDSVSEKSSCAVHKDTKIVASGAFKDYALESITIPNGVRGIGDLAFFNCSRLVSISLPDNLTTIGVSAFAYCNSLLSVNLPANLVELGDGAFSHCALTSIYVPDKVTAIKPYTFDSCKKLFHAYLGKSVKTIDTYAFNGCTTLSSVVIDVFNSKLEEIEAFAFNDCTKLSVLYLPSSLKAVEDKAFVDTLRTIYTLHTKESWVESGLSESSYVNNFNVYLLSKDAPTPNKDKTDFDGKYFFLTEDDRLVHWDYTWSYNGKVYTYSKVEPELNAAGTGYNGDYFFYNEEGAKVIWTYVAD